MDLKKVIQSSLICLTSITVLGCANVKHQSQVYTGENLITPYSGYLAGWKVYTENKPHYHSRMWQHPELGFKNAYVVSVTPREKNNLAHFRTVIDEPGIQSCDNFTSNTIRSNLQANYPVEIWQTNCIRKNTSQAKILHLLVRGKDSLYHVQKIWQGSFESTAEDDWIKRFNEIYVCDTRSQKFPCPEITQ